MNIFQKVFDTLFPKDAGSAFPGPMGDMLAQLGIHELGPHKPSGVPLSVASGCKKKLVLMPSMSQPAYSRKGKPILAKDKHGRTHQVMENYGVSSKAWKQMQNDQKRKAAGRWYSGAEARD
tara:strand:+ start:1238 stop:1600 length:363 start_codon:yes stop_codon:yes gene_type:complete